MTLQAEKMEWTMRLIPVLRSGMSFEAIVLVI